MSTDGVGAARALHAAQALGLRGGTEVDARFTLTGTTLGTVGAGPVGHWHYRLWPTGSGWCERPLDQPGLDITPRRRILQEPSRVTTTAQPSAGRSWYRSRRRTGRLLAPPQRHAGRWPHAAGAASALAVGPCERLRPSPVLALINSLSNSARPPSTETVRRGVVGPGVSQRFEAGAALLLAGASRRTRGVGGGISTAIPHLSRPANASRCMTFCPFSPSPQLPERTRGQRD